MPSRILVVEPYEVIRELFRKVLRRNGHEVAVVKTGGEAISAMDREHFSIVLVGSPVVVKTGDTKVLFLEYVEGHPPKERPCFIVLTTHVEEGQIVGASERLRACAVLAKPFKLEDLLAVVDGCLTGRHTPTRWIGIPEHRSDPVTATPSNREIDVSK